MTPFSQRLRSAMGVRNVTLRDLAAEIGVSPQAVKKYRDGDCLPSSSKLIKLTAYLDVSMEWILHPYDLDMQSTDDAPQGRHAKYWVREAVVELKKQGLIA